MVKRELDGIHPAYLMSSTKNNLGSKSENDNDYSKQCEYNKKYGSPHSACIQWHYFGMIQGEKVNFLSLSPLVSYGSVSSILSRRNFRLLRD